MTMHNPFYRHGPRMVYVAGPMGRGRWVAQPDPLGRLPAPPPQPGDADYIDVSDPFDLAAAVGPDGCRNGRDDVGKLEVLLHLAGVFDVGETDVLHERVQWSLSCRLSPGGALQAAYR